MTTPSQTVGPFFALPGGLPWPDGPAVVAEGTPGAVLISGVVLDGEGVPVPDALIETWQVEPEGFGRHPHDTSEARLASGYAALEGPVSRPGKGSLDGRAIRLHPVGR